MLELEVVETDVTLDLELMQCRLQLLKRQYELLLAVNRNKINYKSNIIQDMRSLIDANIRVLDRILAKD